MGGEGAGVSHTDRAEACLACPKAVPGCLDYFEIKPQAGCNVEGIGPTRDTPEQAVGRG